MSPDANGGRSNVAVNVDDDAWAARRQFCLPVIVPSVLQGKGMAVVSPMLPIFIHVDLKASVAWVGAISSAYGLTQVCFAPCVGVLLARLRYKTSACLALAIIVVSCLLCFTCQNVIELTAARSLGALAVIAWDLSRKVWINVELPKGVRGRVMATLSGLNKLATLLAVGFSGLLAQWLSTRSVFLVQGLLTAMSLVAISIHSVLGPERTTRNSGHQERTTTQSVGLRCVFQQHWRTLGTAGVFCASLNGTRIAWQLVVPLACHSVGLDKQSIGFLSAFCFGVDACVNLTVTGAIMDRFGRKAVGIPALLLMASGFASLASSHGVPTLVTGGILYALGNGLCGGIVQTIAQDVTPSHARSEFLGLWKTVTTQGGLWLPAVFGVASTAFSLSVAVWALAILTVVTALWLALVVKDTAPCREIQAAASTASVPLTLQQTGES